MFLSAATLMISASTSFYTPIANNPPKTSNPSPRLTPFPMPVCLAAPPELVLLPLDDLLALRLADPLNGSPLAHLFATSVITLSGAVRQ
ncbi:hypothetical protein DE146DRAFT_663326 [Phaeosphaeria sp. MPI-PUGE-AT-0046c]|nr:hypothetical protein DE146DRAFT_663326 [Phaeosphaeria sp. MPI-PUGE-AT-0046c]